jgi:Zn finger protein HypA/HybF involved in hydrogenase expression
MHEYSLARDLVNRAIVEAMQQTACQITALNIKVGPQALVDKEALALGAQAAAQDTIAEGCQVYVTEVEEGGIVLESIELEEAT